MAKLIMTADESNDSEKGAGKAVGASNWIAKPFKPEQLTAAIKKVLG